MSDPASSLETLLREKQRWLVTGGAGFIGSHLVETLLQHGQEVICLDNFSTGKRENLDEVATIVGRENWKNLRLIEGDITDPATCRSAMDGVACLLHQAALASVPESIRHPMAFHHTNVGGTLQLFEAARHAGVRRVIYASSSAVYGDDAAEEKREAETGSPLSPYAATKAIMETWAETYAECYSLESVGLRYFNVYGPRQDPSGAYAAVIPLWMDALARGEAARIFGDGETTRDFVSVRDVVTANLLAATCPLPPSQRALVLNVGTGTRTSLRDLFATIRTALSERTPHSTLPDPVFEPFREGDIRHSVADLTRLREVLRFSPQVPLAEGIRELRYGEEQEPTITP